MLPSPAGFPRTPGRDVRRGGEGRSALQPGPSPARGLGGSHAAVSVRSARTWTAAGLEGGWKGALVQSGPVAPSPSRQDTAAARGGGALRSRARGGAGAKNTRRQRLRGFCWGCGAVGRGGRAGPIWVPLSDMLTFFLVSGGSLWLFSGKSSPSPRPLL